MKRIRSRVVNVGRLMVLLAATCWPLLAPAAEATRDEIVSTMKRAATFMSDKVALHGGVVWVVSEDLSQRWGELTARPSQIWLQGGTERYGQVMLDAYEATGDDTFLDIARAAADALVYGQLPGGGWHYFIDFDPQGVPAWYESEASKFRFGMEEYRHFYGNATFDDRVTADAAKFLLRFYNLTLEAAYRTPVERSLEFVMRAQYENGAWPQRFPPQGEYAHDGFPDYTAYYTLNDGATRSNIELLLEAWQSLGDPRYFDHALLAVDALIAMQGPEDQACWAEQYGPDMQPIAARTHEPAGYVVRESIGVMTILLRFHLMTGDREYLEPIPACLDWFDRINRESREAQYPRPRYWEPGSNKPVYVVRTDELTPEGYGVFLWTSDPAKTRCNGGPCRWDGKPIVDVAYFREQFEQVLSSSTAEARNAYLAKMLASQARRPQSGESVAEIIGALDHRGAWVTDGNVVNQPNARSDDELHPSIRGISTATFAARMSTLIAALRTTEKQD